MSLYLHLLGERRANRLSLSIHVDIQELDLGIYSRFNNEVYLAKTSQYSAEVHSQTTERGCQNMC